MEDKEAGWWFKARGRIQYDAGYVSNPDDDPNGSLITRNLGFNTRARRIRLGAEGTIPGGFGYKFEMDFANATVGFGDCILTYAPTAIAVQLRHRQPGNQQRPRADQQLALSQLHRARAFDDAFINTRRLGINVGYVNKAGDFRLNAGLLAAHSIDCSLDNERLDRRGARSLFAADGRQPAALRHQLPAPRVPDEQRQRRSRHSGSGQPSTNQLARYRARPFSQLTDVRFVDTGNFAAKSDDIIGLEAAGIFKSLHVAAEGQYLKSNAYDAGDMIPEPRSRGCARPVPRLIRAARSCRTAIPASGAAISRPAIS